MSVIRVKKEEKYAVISNEILTNKDLSWEARGIMAYLLSKPDGWQCRNYDLVNQGPSGKHIIQRVINELQEAGYIHRYQVSDGHKIEWITEIYETPELNTTFRNPDFPQAEEPSGGNSAGRKSGDIVSTDPNKYLPTENTEKSMAKNAESDFSDLFPDTSEQPATPPSPKPLDENGKAHLLALGVLPDDKPDPEVYAIRQELQAAGWEIHSTDVELAIVFFVLAVRSQHPGFKIPNDTGSRKHWYQSVNAHLANYKLSELQDLYKRAIIKMVEKKLSYWVPGSLTNWALPEIANETRSTQDIDISKGFYV